MGRRHSLKTIYSAAYALPIGESRKELIICLRQGKSLHRTHVAGVDCRDQLPDMVSIRVRPPEIEDRAVFNQCQHVLDFNEICLSLFVHLLKGNYRGVVILFCYRIILI